MVCLNVYLHGSRFIKTIITLLASTIRCLPMLCLNVYLHGSRFIKSIVTLLTSIRLHPMLCLNVLLHSSRFIKTIVTLLASIHTTSVDALNSMPAILVTKVSVVSQISDCTLVYTIHIRLHAMPVIHVENVSMDSHI